jgi:hypothetical protein
LPGPFPPLSSRISLPAKETQTASIRVKREKAAFFIERLVLTFEGIKGKAQILMLKS